VNKAVIEITNVFGEKVFEQEIELSSKREVSFENVSSGIYFVKLRDGNKQITRKLVVERN
jgi:hypothetical protein